MAHRDATPTASAQGGSIGALMGLGALSAVIGAILLVFLGGG